MKHSAAAATRPPLRFRRFFLLCGLILFASEIWKQLCLTFFVNGGAYLWRHFPFQLCSIPMYILLFLPHVRSVRVRDMLLTFLMTFGLLGGCIVFADTSGLNYPTFPALTVHSYLWHLLLIAVGLLAGMARRAPAPRDLLHAVLLYLGCCGLATAFNFAFGGLGEINMFYINPAYPMEQVVFSALVPVLGNNTVLALYIAVTALGASLLWMLWRAVFHFIDAKSKKRTDAQ